MTKLKSFMLAAALVAPGALVATQAAAQVGGVAIANPRGAIAASRAFQAAQQQIRTTYKAQLDQADARTRALQTELQPLVTAYQNAARAPNATQASVAPSAQALETRQQAAQQELARITAPAERAQAYALEQIATRYNEAMQNVVRQRNVGLVVSPEAALFAQPNADITPAITAELDRLVPTVSITPPANWQPGQQQGAAGTAPAATAPATPVRQPAQPTRRNSGR